MDKNKADGVVEAVHYGKDGQVKWVRAYERRGPTYSDVIIIDRDSLVKRIKSGKKFYAGQRILYKASTFSLHQPFQLIQKEGKQILVTGDTQGDHDFLNGVPVI